MERRRYSLRLVLAVSLVGLQFIAVSAIIFFTFLSSERALLRQSHALLEEAGETIVGRVRNFLAPARQSLDVTRRLAENGVLDTSDDSLLESHLFQQLLVAPQISGFYFAEANGRFVYVMRTEIAGQYRTKIINPFAEEHPNHPASFIWRNDQFEVLDTAFEENDTYEARTRPWYTMVEATRARGWTDPYIYYTSRQPGITYAAPVLAENGNVTGILGIDIDINAISGFLAALWEGRGGAAIIMNHNGEVLAHPELSLIRNDEDLDFPALTLVDQIEDSVAKAAFEGFPRLAGELKNDAMPSELELDGQRFVSMLVPVPEPELAWTVGIYAPVDTFIGEINKDRARWFWVAGVVAILTGLIGLRLADWINRPLTAFAQGAMRAAQSDEKLEDILRDPYKEMEGTGESLMREIRTRQKFETAYGRTFELASRGMAQIEPKNGKFAQVNEQLSDLLGMSSEKLTTLSMFDLVPTGSSNPLRDFRTTLNETSEFIQDVRFDLPDGTATWLRVNAILILDETGAPDHALAIFDDVNEQKRTAETTQQLNREVRHLSRVNLMGEMASGIAHELNQPLSAIAYNADALRLALEDMQIDDQEVNQICADIERQALRAGDIIRALRDLMRKDRGRMATFDLVDLCSQTIKLVEVEAREQSIQVDFAPQTSMRVNGNRTQIAQVLVNLLRNAIESLADQDDQHKRITVRLTARDNEIMTCVQDTGIGVPPGHELFRQFDTFKSGGMGLGLSIARSIIEAHGGIIWHEAPPEGGARFCFTLQQNSETTEAGK